MNRNPLPRRSIPTAVALALVLAARAPAAPVCEVRVESGGRPAAAGAVIDQVSVRAGQEFDRARIMQDVRTLEKSRRFSDVRVRAERQGDGVVVVFSVEPRLRIAELRVEGADTIGNHKVRDLMGVGVGDLVDEAALAAGARRVQDEYFKKFFPDTRVAWRIAPVSGIESVGVSVTVKEGKKAVVRNIRFEGTRLFSDDALRETMTTRRYRWFNPVQWFTSAGRVDEDAMAGDVFRLRRLYADAGYLDTEVSGPELVPAGRRRVDAVYRVREGRQYTLSGVRVSGAEKIPSAELERVLRVRPGQLASRNQIDDAAGVLLDYYGNRGYVRTSVDPVIDPDAKAGQADLTFRIREGEVARIRDIRILGNVQTHDKVIRRELVVEPGQIFHRSRIRSSERRLMNLGYFATVFSFPEPTADPAYNDLVFQVEEQRMGQANVGAGFSSIDSFTTIFELSHGNMDLTGWPPVGAGQKLRLRGTLGTRRTDVSLSFIEPYFLDRRLSLGTDLFRSDLRFESNDYNIRRTGGEVSLTHPLGRFNRIRGAYGLEEVSVYDVEDTASPIIRAEEGDRLKSSLSMSLSHESRDQLWAPTRGNTSRLMTGVAGGPLGADVDWYRAEFQTAQYIPVASNHVLLLRGRIAGIREFGDSDSVPIFDRLFLGGPLNVRAFKYREVGPVDEEEEPIGGRALAFASAEYLIRLGRMVRLSAYVDGGQVWSDAFSYDLRWNSGYGVGVYIDLPMLPLKFFYAWPIDAEEYNQHDGGVFSFLMGHAF